MFRLCSVILLLSSARADIPLQESVNNVNFREKEANLKDGEAAREASNEASSTGTRWPWSISDDQIHVEFIQNTKQRTVEILTNSGEGAGYMGEIIVGGQPLKAIWDTGSDQQVVNSVRTMNFLAPCGMAPGHCYDNRKSNTYHRLSPVPRKVSYGSGDTFVLLGDEEIGNKVGKVGKMPFYELLTTNIPNILEHELDVVAGLGPRGWKGVTFVKEMQIDRFSFCFPSDNKKNGYLIWNDYAAPGHFNNMAVAGPSPTYWSLKANNFHLRHPTGMTPLKFDGECIVDTGTSLITLDQETLQQVEQHLSTFDEKNQFECSDATLNKFPDIGFHLNGQYHRFRAQDYMMYTEAQEIPDAIKPFMWMGLPVQPTNTKKCVLMFTPPMEKGMCILGMPFMRNYYTTFNRKSGMVHTALHDGNCNMAAGAAAAPATVAAPAAPVQAVANVTAPEDNSPFTTWKAAWAKVTGASFRQKLDTSKQTLRRIDLSKLHFSDGFMSLWQNHQERLQGLEKAVDKAAEKVGLGNNIDKKQGGLLLREKA